MPELKLTTSAPEGYIEVTLIVELCIEGKRAATVIAADGYLPTNFKARQEIILPTTPGTEPQKMYLPGTPICFGAEYTHIEIMSAFINDDGRWWVSVEISTAKKEEEYFINWFQSNGWTVDEDF